MNDFYIVKVFDDVVYFFIGIILLFEADGRRIFLKFSKLDETKSTSFDIFSNYKL